MLDQNKITFLTNILNYAQRKRNEEDLNKAASNLSKLPPAELVKYLTGDIDLMREVQGIKIERKNPLRLFEKYAQLFFRDLVYGSEIKEEDFLSLNWLFDYFYLNKEILNFKDKQIIERKFPVDEDKIDKVLKAFYNPDKKKNLTNAFQGFPTKEAWRLCVNLDHQIQEKYKIWNRYEGQHELNESQDIGYIKGTFNGFISAIRNFEKKLSLELMKKLHAICQNSKYLSAIHTEKTLNFPINLNDEMSYDGYNELQEKYILSAEVGRDLEDNNTKPAYQVSYTDKYNENKLILQKMCTSESHTSFVQAGLNFANMEDERSNVEEKINYIIKQYNKNIENPDIKVNPRLLLKEIVKMVKELHCIHPFTDANSRLFYFVLINKELIRHGFSPMIINNSEIFSGLSDEQIIQYVIIPGMKNFQAVKSGNLPEGMVTTNQLIEKHGKEQYHIPEILESKETDLFDFLQKTRTNVENPEVSPSTFGGKTNVFVVTHYSK